MDASELTIAEIATQYDVSPATIYRRLSLLERINLSIELIDASSIIVTESTPDQRKSVYIMSRGNYLGLWLGDMRADSVAKSETWVGGGNALFKLGTAWRPWACGSPSLSCLSHLSSCQKRFDGGAL